MGMQTRYDKYNRNPEARKFYKSAAWKKCRELVLQGDNHLCQHCLKQGKVNPADMVHHIVELLDDWDKALDMDNLESLCNPCHNKHHGYRGKTKQKVSSKVKVIKSKANNEVI